MRHKHVQVNGKTVNIPSFLVKPGDVVSGPREAASRRAACSGAQAGVDRRGVPEWLELDKEKLEGTVKTMPNREEITLPIQEQLIVEFYSR